MDRGLTRKYSVNMEHLNINYRMSVTVSLCYLLVYVNTQRDIGTHVFETKEFNEIFSGRHTRQDVKFSPTFRQLTLSPSSGWRIEIFSGRHTRQDVKVSRSFGKSLPIFTLKMETELFAETSGKNFTSCRVCLPEKLSLNTNRCAILNHPREFQGRRSGTNINNIHSQILSPRSVIQFSEVVKLVIGKESTVCPSQISESRMGTIAWE